MFLAALVVPLLEAGNGVKVGPPVLVAHGDAPAGAVDRLGALATWRDRGCIKLERLTADATPGTPILLGCGATGAPRAASSGNVTLVVWPAGADLAGALVEPDLHVTPVHAKSDNPVAVTTVFDGDNFLVTTASCTSAQLIEIGIYGAVHRTTSLKATKPHDEIAIAGAGLACDGGHCEVAYAVANNTLGIGCEDQIRKPRWSWLATATVIGGVPGAFTQLDNSSIDRPTYPEKDMITRHGVAWSLGGFNWRRDSGDSVIGSLVATTTYHSELWNGRETLGPDHLEVEFVPAELVPRPKDARHAPLEVPGETSPAVLFVGGDRFVLLTVAHDGVLARAITIDPAWFAHPPQPRGPVLTGTLRSSSQKPPPMARIGCLLRRGSCGEATIQADGTFVLPVDDPLDFRVATQTDAAPIVAYSNDEYWFSPALHETRAAIQLIAAAHLTGTIAWPAGTRPKVAPLPVEREEYGPHAGDVLGEPRDPLELTFEAQAVVPVIAPYGMEAVASMYSYPLRADGTFDVPVAATGRALLTARTANKDYGASVWVKTEPGKPAHVDLALHKTSTLVIRLKGHRMTGDDDMRLSANRAGCMDGGTGCTFDHVAPGPQLVNFTTPDWSMVRAIDVPPGANKIVDLPFVPDLPAGDPGVRILRAIDGITVTAVAPGGPAAGLLATSDVITAIDSAPIGTDLAAAIAKLRGAPDSRVEMTITRARRSQKLTLKRSHGTPAP